MNDSRRIAEIQYLQGREPVLQILVPKGTTLSDLTPVLTTISKEISPKISLTGCSACTSGNHLWIKEKLEDLVTVDLGNSIQVDIDTGSILKGIR